MVNITIIKNLKIYEINTWEDLNVKIELLRGIYANGFETTKSNSTQRYCTNY